MRRTLIAISKSINHFLDPNANLYSLKQAQIWSQEYASLSGSSANSKSKQEWESRITERHALTEKVLTCSPKKQIVSGL